MKATDAFKDSLEQEVIRARQTLPSNDDWDGEGAPGFKEQTIDAAAAFLRQQADLALRNSGVMIDIPILAPGPGDGSVDVFWNKDYYQLLVNISADLSDTIAYYGCDLPRCDNEIQGTVDRHDPSIELTYWLAAHSHN